MRCFVFVLTEIPFEVESAFAFYRINIFEMLYLKSKQTEKIDTVYEKYSTLCTFIIRSISITRLCVRVISVGLQFFWVLNVKIRKNTKQQTAQTTVYIYTQYECSLLIAADDGVFFFSFTRTVVSHNQFELGKLFVHCIQCAVHTAHDCCLCCFILFCFILFYSSVLFLVHAFYLTLM